MINSISETSSDSDLTDCPSCGFRALTWNHHANLWVCRHPDCGFTAAPIDLKAARNVRQELEWKACRNLHSNDLLKLANSDRATVHQRAEEWGLVPSPEWITAAYAVVKAWRVVLNTPSEDDSTHKGKAARALWVALDRLDDLTRPVE